MTFDGRPLPLPPSDQFQPAPWRARLAQRTQDLTPELFAPSILNLLYEYALTRNAWGTTNIDAAPIDQDRVSDLRDAYLRGAEHHARIQPTEREVVHYFELLADLPRSRFALSLDDIRLIHAEYFRDVPLDNRGDPGRWKRRRNVITGPGNHVTPTTSPEDVPKHLENLVTWWNALHDPGPEHVGLFFHTFQRIHPFDDGNGRTGRVLCLQLLASIGHEHIRYCPIDDTLNRERGEYLIALSEADVGRTARWLSLFLSAIDDGYRRALLLARRLQQVPSDVAPEAFDALAWAYIHGRRAFAPADVAHLWSDVTDRTRRRHMARLVDLGILQAEGDTRGRTYRLRPGGPG